MVKKLPELGLFSAMSRGIKAVVNKEPIFKYGKNTKTKIGTILHIYDPSREEGSKLFTVPKWK